MDDTAGQRSMFVGFLIGFAFYAMSFVVPFLVPGSMGQWISFGLIAAAMAFIIGWFIAVRRGFRVSKAEAAGPNRMERKLRAHKDDEREKLRKARLRR